MHKVYIGTQVQQNFRGFLFSNPPKPWMKMVQSLPLYPIDSLWEMTVVVLFLESLLIQFLMNRHWMRAVAQKDWVQFQECSAEVKEGNVAPLCNSFLYSKTNSSGFLGFDSLLGLDFSYNL